MDADERIAGKALNGRRLSTKSWSATLTDDTERMLSVIDDPDPITASVWDEKVRYVQDVLESRMFVKSDDSFSPPQGVIEEAKRALKWMSEGHAGDGFTDVGRARAKQLASGSSVSLATIKRMKSYLARHNVDKQGQGWSPGDQGYPSPGRVAWAAWGGNAAIGWVNKIVRSSEKSLLEEVDPFAQVATVFHYSASLNKKQAPIKEDCGCGCNDCGSEEETEPFVLRLYSKADDVVSFHESSIMTGSMSRRQNLIDMKVAIIATASGERTMLHNPTGHILPLPVVRTKTGLVRSNNSLGRAAQAATSYVIPGDMSRLRSPVRSTVYRALTPGGGGGRGRMLARIGGNQIRHCPPGYEHGGRFANRTFSNCGTQLFEMALIGAANAANGVNNRGRTSVVGAPSIRRGEAVQAGEYLGSSIDIQRAAQIPPIAKASAKKMEEVVAKEVRTANSATGDYLRLIRSDGVILSPVSDVNRISKQRKNPDIAGGTWITTVASPTNIGGNEVSLFGAGIVSIRYALPGSGELGISAIKPISQGRAAALRRSLEAARRSGDEGGAALRQMVRDSKGDLVYVESFPGINKPNELVVVKKGNETKTVARWIYESWMSGDSKGKNSSRESWSIVDTVSVQGNDDAIETTKKAEATMESLLATDSFQRGSVIDKAKTSDYGNGRRLVTMSDGTVWVETKGSGVSHLGTVVGNDIANALGVPAPASLIVGKANDRRSLVQLPGSFDKGKPDYDMAISDVQAQDVARLVLLDYLTNNEGRTPGTVVPLKGQGVDIASFSNGRNLLAAGGRFTGLDLPAYLKQDGSARWLLEKIKEQESIKAKVAQMYEDMLKNAQQFDWDAYVARLQIAGITDSEKNHLETIKRLFSSRADQMKSSRKMFLRTLGVNI